MRERALARIGSALFALAAAACGQDDFDSAYALTCTDDLGCPTGMRCVEGRYCEAIAGFDGGSLFRISPPEASGGASGGGGGSAQRDAGAGVDEAGVLRDGSVLSDAGDAPGGCFGGQLLCDVICTDVQSDPGNCGGCGIACAGAQTCRLGVCCDAGETVCGTVCTDLSSDVRNCGACGVSCGSSGECVLGTCQPSLNGPGLPEGDSPFGD